MKANKLLIFVGLVLIFVLSGCLGRSPITSFQGPIETIRISDNEILVDCSDAVNKNKKGVIPTTAHIFIVQLDKNSKIIGKDNEQLSIHDLKEKQEVKVILNNPIDIDEIKIGTAKEIKVSQ